MRKKYNLYLRDLFGDEANNELHFIFDSIDEVLLFIPVIDKFAAESYVYELKRED